MRKSKVDNPTHSLFVVHVISTIDLFCIHQRLRLLTLYPKVISYYHFRGVESIIYKIRDGKKVSVYTNLDLFGVKGYV